MKSVKNSIRPTRTDRLFDAINTFLLALVLLVVAYPLYFVVCASFSDPLAVSGGEVLFAPVRFTLAGYKKILEYSLIWIGYRNTIFYTALGTFISLFLVVTLSYPLSRKDFKLRNLLTVMIAVTMFFSGGMIPTYLVVKKLGMLNTIWSIVLPGAIAANWIIITRTFFQTIPADLTEAAAIDGCTNFKAFYYIILPLSKAILAVIGLYAASGLWNGYFSAMLYLRDNKKYPLQLFLRQILLLNDMSNADISSDSLADEQYLAELIKYGVIIVSSLPMMVVYPMIQKYFVKGVMIGSIKG